MSARTMVGAWEPYRDDVRSEQLLKLQTTEVRAAVEAADDGSVQVSRSAHALREQGGKPIEDVQLRGSKKRAVEQSLGMRKFVRICGVDRMSPLVLL